MMHTPAMINNGNLCDLESFWKESSLKNRLQNHRCIAWRYFLGCFDQNSPPSSWGGQILESRKSYAALKEQPSSGRHQVSDTDHPLSTDDTSTWKAYFQNEELKKLIALDVDRTFPECAFFREQETQQALKDILFVFCSTKLRNQYRQGMHEILALIYLVLEQELRSDPSSQPYRDLSPVIYDRSCCESDAFVLFEKVMSIVAPWYDLVPTDQEKLQVGHYLHNELLKTIDPDLYNHLSMLGMEPQYYTVKWLRLIFAREFSIRQVLFLWDLLLTSGNPRQSIQYFALSLLTSKREDLLRAGALHEAMPIMVRPYSLIDECVEDSLSCTSPLSSSEEMIIYYMSKANVLSQKYNENRKIKHDKSVFPSCNTNDIFHILKSEIYDWFIEISLQSDGKVTVDRNTLDVKKSLLERILFSLAEM